MRYPESQKPQYQAKLKRQERETNQHYVFQQGKYIYIIDTSKMPKCTDGLRVLLKE